MTEKNLNGAKLRVGYGKADITPGMGVHLAGFGTSYLRDCRGVLSPLYALTVAITDEKENSFILVVADMGCATGKRNQSIREKLQKAYGIPPESVIVAATHDHNGGSDVYPSPENRAYVEQLENAVVQSVGEALKDRAPATIEIGRTKTKNLTFSRRYRRADGNFVGGGPVKWNIPSDAPIVGHESEADEEIQLVRFVRENEKDILLTNWQAHLCNIHMETTHPHHYMASADWVGAMRDTVEKELGVHCVFIQGAAGNLGILSRIEGELAVEDFYDFHMVGDAVAKYVIDACKDEKAFRQIEAGPIKRDRHTITLEAREDLETSEDPYACNNPEVFRRIESGELKKSLSEPSSKTGKAAAAPEEITKKEMNTVAIGGLSLVTLPLEMFDANAKWLKDATPFDMTLIAGYSCGSDSYLAPEWAFDHGCYEVLFGRYKRGEAEKIFSDYLDTLNKLKAE